MLSHYIFPGAVQKNRSKIRVDSSPVDLTSHILRLDDHPVAGGSFGNVYRGIYRTTSGEMQVAVKALRFLPTSDDIRRIRREIKIWMKLKHQNIVPFIGVTAGFGPPETISLVSPWISNGTLTSFLETCGGRLLLMSKLWLVKLARHPSNGPKGAETSIKSQQLHDIAAGLNYLHSFPLIHGDLTGSNVLINTEGTAYLVDFGLSTVIGGLEGGSSIFPSSHRPGAIRWTAPELLGLPEISYSPTPKSDIYSFGSVMLQILSNRFPWYTETGTTAEFRIIAKLIVGEIPPRPDDLPIVEKYWALISECWRPISSAESRPTAGQLIDTIGQEIIICSGGTNNGSHLLRSAHLSEPVRNDIRPEPDRITPNPSHALIGARSVTPYTRIIAGTFFSLSLAACTIFPPYGAGSVQVSYAPAPAPTPTPENNTHIHIELPTHTDTLYVYTTAES